MKTKKKTKEDDSLPVYRIESLWLNQNDGLCVKAKDTKSGKDTIFVLKDPEGIRDTINHLFDNPGDIAQMYSDSIETNGRKPS